MHYIPSMPAKLSSKIGRHAKSGSVNTKGKDVKFSSGSVMTVRNAKSGQMVTVRGAGALKDSGFAIKKGVDLTKPIAKQALKASLKGKSRLRAEARKVASKD